MDRRKKKVLTRMGKKMGDGLIGMRWDRSGMKELTLMGILFLIKDGTKMGQ